MVERFKIMALSIEKFGGIKSILKNLVEIIDYYLVNKRIEKNMNEDMLDIVNKLPPTTDNECVFKAIFLLQYLDNQ